MGQFQRHAQHRGAVKRHPRRAIRLLQRAAGGQGLRAIKHTDVIQPEESARKKVFAVSIFAVHPPGEVQQ